MHLDEERLERLRHGELAPDAERTAREHLASCPECRALVGEAAREEEAMDALLRRLDHPAPAVSAATLASRARARARLGVPLRLRLVAAVLLALALAGAALAIPGSPLRLWVASVARWVAERRESGRAAAPGREPAVAGISVAPGERLVVEFAARQTRGEVSIVLIDSAELIVRAPAGAARFTADQTRLAIDNRDGDAGFEIGIPRGAPLVEIRVAGQRVFLKQGTRVVTVSGADDSGRWVFPLTAAAP